MKILFNQVLIRPDREENDMIKMGDTELKLVTAYDEFKHKVVTGTVVQLPESLIFNRRKGYLCQKFDTEIELQVGDRIIFHYLAVHAAKKQYDPYLLKDVPKDHTLIPYDQIFVAIRGTEVIPINGYLLVEPVDEEVKTNLEIPDSAKKKATVRGIIRYMGKPVNGYRDFPDVGPDTDEVKVGDEVFYRACNCVPLEYALHQTLDRGKILYRMQRNDLIGVVA